MLLTKFKRDVRNLTRVKDIFTVLAKYGFGYLIDSIDIHLPFQHPKTHETIEELSMQARVRLVFEELGPTFIKLGQMLSLRPDIIPYSYCKEFEKLQDAVSPLPFETMQTVIENEYHLPYDQVFDDFDTTCIASASLAQVYKATYQGQDVIVKIQKPDLEKKIQSDLDILEFFVDFASKRHLKEAELFNFAQILKEFRRYILKELDFYNEAVNINIFRKNFKENTTTTFPHVFKKKSTKRILITEKINGTKISKLNTDGQDNWDTKKIAQIGSDSILQQIFIDGFFHGDPHPGNILVLENEKICFLDFGVVGRIDDETKFKLADIFLAVIDKDINRVIESLRILGALENVHVKNLYFNIQEMIDKYYDISLEELNVATFLNELMRLITENRIKLLPDLFILVRALITIEGVGKSLDPGFNIVVNAKSFSAKIIRQRFQTKRLLKQLRKFSNESLYFIGNFPQDIMTILGLIKRGEVKLAFEHRNLEKFIFTLDKISNRIALSLIISSLVIASSIVIHSNIGPFWGNFPIIGLVGFIIAGIFSFVLLISIIRSGKF